MTQISKDAPTRSTKIVDSPAVIVKLLCVIVGLFLFFVSLIMVNAPNNSDAFQGLVMLIIFGPLTILGIITFIVNAKGYVIDVENDTLTFPGGGIEADSWTSYFNPMYWLQGFKRHQIQLSAIREVQAYQNTETSVSNQGKVRTSKTNKLDISGDFGAISFTFKSKGKCDQFHSAIVSLNKMGDPMLKR